MGKVHSVSHNIRGCPWAPKKSGVGVERLGIFAYILIFHLYTNISVSLWCLIVLKKALKQGDYQKKYGTVTLFLPPDPTGLNLVKATLPSHKWAQFYLSSFFQVS